MPSPGSPFWHDQWNFAALVAMFVHTAGATAGAGRPEGHILWTSWSGFRMVPGRIRFERLKQNRFVLGLYRTGSFS